MISRNAGGLNRSQRIACDLATSSQAPPCAHAPQFFRACLTIAGELQQGYAMSGIDSIPGKALARELVKLGGNHMSVSEDRDSVAPAVQPAAAAAPVADPGPLGLAAFALTTFLLSAVNAHWTAGNSAGTAFLGYALAYGGVGPLLAGIWG